ncbi:MAG TPA: alkaline phosphatase family protein [Acidimicrobiales bacterium]|nr:alkaline phosphatase family protein [Acidimicrobiales bacterium]
MLRLVNHRRVLRRLGLGTLASMMSLVGATSLAANSATASPKPTTNAPHVMTIMMENTDYSQFVGSPQMPYVNELSHEYANFTQAYGWTYPSLPNYLELLSGSDWGTSGNDCDITDAGCSNFAGPTLVNQLANAGLTWNAYYQGDASGCDQSDGSGNYPYWHNAFRYFADFSALCKNISSFSDLNSNLNSPNASDFQWVVPDLVNSGGDNGTMQSGDSWLNGELPQIMNSTWYRQGGQIVIIYDTGYNDQSTTPAQGGQIPMVVVSAHTKGMGSVAAPIDTAGVLRSIEQVYGLSYLGDAANASNGDLGNALVSGRSTGSNAHDTSNGAILTTSLKGSSNVDNDMFNQVTGLNGVATVPASAKGGVSGNAQNQPGQQNRQSATIAVGEGADGRGTITDNGRTISVPNTSALESVSCVTSTQCYAVGLAPSNDDEGVLVSIRNGQPTTETPEPTFLGLYGIDCTTASVCYAVGFDTSDDADAVTTITNGEAGPVNEVEPGQGVGEWLNAISCPTSTQCFAVGLVNYYPSIVPITNGVPGTPVTISDGGDAWYVNGIDCASVNYCVAVGENNNEQGIVSTLVNGAMGTTQVVSGTENLYGAACDTKGDCILTGASVPASNGYSVGTVTDMVNGTLQNTRTVAGTNGFGQIVCSQDLDSCVSAGAAYRL